MMKEKFEEEEKEEEEEDDERSGRGGRDLRPRRCLHFLKEKIPREHTEPFVF